MDMSQPANILPYVMEVVYQNNLREAIKSRVTLEDLYHVLYLKPIECVLDQKKEGLAIGLKIVDRKSETQYELK
jgi:hypothetical protein